jgi:hypothetical protein
MKTHITYSLYREYDSLRYHVAIYREAPLPEKINVLFYNGPYELDKALEIIKNRKRPPKDSYSNKQERYDAWIKDNRVRVVAEECVSQEGTVHSWIADTDIPEQDHYKIVKMMDDEDNNVRPDKE